RAFWSRVFSPELMAISLSGLRKAGLQEEGAGPCRRAMLFLSRQVCEETMIHHLSIAARDPQHVAGVLAEFMGGKAVPFPPNPGSFFALQLDEHGSGVEVYPAGAELQPGGTNGGRFVKKEARGYGPTHFALSVATHAG